AEKKFSISSIVRRDDFIVREHIADYIGQRRLSRPNQRAARMFSLLVDWHRGQGGSSRRPRGNPMPYSGVTVKPREELGIEPCNIKGIDPYGPSRILAQYAVKASSVVYLANVIQNEMPQAMSGPRLEIVNLG